MYCNVNFEYTDQVRRALFNNWLVNLYGKPGHFREIDHLQEEFNRWLEELAQMKGKDFDNPWYRDVLAMNVHHFLRLIEEMEKNVSLVPRTKKHKAPHLDNELREVMRICRRHDLHCHRPGRDYGFHSVNDYAAGYKVLELDGKLKAYVEKGLVAEGNRTMKNEYPKDGVDYIAGYLHD